MTTRYGELDSSQKDALEGMKKRIAKMLEEQPDYETKIKENHCEYLKEDNDLLRFLKARKWDVEAAFNMWKNLLDWRFTFQGGIVNFKAER